MMSGRILCGPVVGGTVILPRRVKKLAHKMHGEPIDAIRHNITKGIQKLHDSAGAGSSREIAEGQEMTAEDSGGWLIKHFGGRHFSGLEDPGGRLDVTRVSHHRSDIRIQ